MIQNSDIFSEAIILLLQDMRERKDRNTNKGGQYWREATSLLERLGAPFSPYMDTDKAEDKTTAHISREQAKAAWDEMFEDSMKALDDLKPEWTGHDTYTKQLEEICTDRRIKCERLQDKVTTLKARLTRQEEELDRLVAERDKLADQLADAGVDILDLRNELAFTEGERAKVADELTDMENDRDKWRERVKYLEVECDRIQVYCENLMKANTRLMDEKNKAAVAAIEGVA